MKVSKNAKRRENESSVRKISRKEYIENLPLIYFFKMCQIKLNIGFVTDAEMVPRVMPFWARTLRLASHP